MLTEQQIAQIEYAITSGDSLLAYQAASIDNVTGLCTTVRVLQARNTAMRCLCLEKVKEWLSKANFDYGPLVKELESLLLAHDQGSDSQRGLIEP